MFERKVRCWNISLGQQFLIYQESLSPCLVTASAEKSPRRPTEGFCSLMMPAGVGWRSELFEIRAAT